MSPAGKAGLDGTKTSLSIFWASPAYLHREMYDFVFAPPRLAVAYTPKYAARTCKTAVVRCFLHARMFYRSTWLRNMIRL